MTSLVTVSHLRMATSLFSMSRMVLDTTNDPNINFGKLVETDACRVHAADTYLDNVAEEEEEKTFPPCGWCGSTRGTNEDNGWTVDDWPRCIDCQGC